MKKTKRRLLWSTFLCLLYLPSAQANFWDDLVESVEEITEATEAAVKETEAAVKEIIPGEESTEDNAQPPDKYNSIPYYVLPTQIELKRIGYEVSVDGAYGPDTRLAIMQFENDNGLKPTGNVSPQLLEKLKVTKPETSIVKTTPETTNKTNAVSAGGSGGKVERLTESDIQADRSLFLRGGDLMPGADAFIAECTKARDPVLRENFITILNAQSNGEPADVKAVADSIANYDSGFDTQKHITSKTPCTPQLIEKSYANFALSQNRWISAIEERAKSQAAQSTPSTPPAAPTEEDNARFCRKITRRINQCNGAACWDAPAIDSLRQRPEVNEKCSCNWTAGEGLLICEPLKSKDEDHTAFCQQFASTATSAEKNCVMPGSRSCGVVTPRIAEADKKCACRGAPDGGIVCASM